MWVYFWLVHMDMLSRSNEPHRWMRWMKRTESKNLKGLFIQKLISPLLFWSWTPLTCSVHGNNVIAVLKTSIHLSFSHSIYPSIYCSFNSSIVLSLSSIRLSVCLSVYLSIYLSFMSVYLSIYLSVCVLFYRSSFCLLIYHSVCLSIVLSIILFLSITLSVFQLYYSSFCPRIILFIIPYII